MTDSSKFNPTRFAVSEATDVGALGVTRQLSIPVRKPNKSQFFRAHPGLQQTVPLLEFKEEQQFYLLTPEVANQLPGDFTIRQLSLCVNRQGDLFLWPVPVLAQDGRAPLRWHESARAALKQAMTHWVRMGANMIAGEYDIYQSNADVEPNWRGVDDIELVFRTAFGDQYLIESTDHPVVQKLLGYM